MPMTKAETARERTLDFVEAAHKLATVYQNGDINDKDDRAEMRRLWKQIGDLIDAADRSYLGGEDVIEGIQILCGDVRKALRTGEKIMTEQQYGIAA